MRLYGSAIKRSVSLIILLGNAIIGTVLIKTVGSDQGTQAGDGSVKSKAQSLVSKTRETVGVRLRSWDGCIFARRLVQVPGNRFFMG